MSEKSDKKKQKEGKKDIRIPKVQRGFVEVKVRNIKGSSLLMHRKSEEAMNKIKVKQSGGSNINLKAPKDAEVEFERAKYKDEQGKLYIPGNAFKAAIIAASEFLGIHKTTLRKTVFVMTDHVYLTKHSQPKINEQFLRINQSGMDWRIRPEIDEWECIVPVMFNKNHTSVEQIYSLIDHAGFHCGLLDNRPNSPKCSGNHGMFELVM